MAETTYDLIVIGAGPGGYVGAIRASQLGFKTACVEAKYLGGTCLNVGCIPTKAMLDSTERLHEAKHSLAKHGINVGDIKVDLGQMLKRKAEVVKGLTTGIGSLFKKNKVDHLPGLGRIVKAGEVEVTATDGKKTIYRTKRILIATGSDSIELPTIKFDHKRILSSTEAMSLTEIPKKLVVIGAGYIGLELGSVWARMGSEVLFLEFADRPVPQMDKEMVTLLQRALEKQGMKFKFKTVAEKVEVTPKGVKVHWKSGDQTGSEEADVVLVSVGRRPVTKGLGLDEAGIKTDAKGFITVDKHYQTSLPGVYAVGDVVGGLMLAHKAEEEGVAAVELMAGKAGHVNYATVPGVIYTMPELASVGLSEDDAKARGPIKVGKFPMMANSRARAMDMSEGSVKIIADANTDRILGVHIVAARAGEMIAEATVAMEFASSAEDIARSFHAHPTMAEAVKEAALAVDKRTINM